MDGPWFTERSVNVLSLSAPLFPDPDDARKLAEAELGKAEYAATEVSWWDRAAQSVAAWFGDLFRVSAEAVGGSNILLIIIAVVIIGLLVAAYFIWGRPRWNASSQLTSDALFDEDDARSASELRRDAEAHARAQEWNEAIIVRFRAVARALFERGAVTVGAGATVHAFATQASTAFPTEDVALRSLAGTFDDVRYLRRPGTAAAYEQIVALDRRLESLRPAQLATIGADA